MKAIIGMDAGVRSISRSLAVLRAVNAAGSLSVTEISQVCDIPYPTARRITMTLVREGVIEREPARKRYRPTVLVKALSHGYQDHSGMTEVARPLLAEFTRDHLWPAALMTRVGQLMIVRDSTHAISPMALANYQAGATFPLLESASGHCYLAYAGEEMREQLLKGALAQRGREFDSLMMRQFQSGALPSEIRKAGYAFRHRNRFTNTPGRTSSIAAPIFLNGKVCGSLVVEVFANAMTMGEAQDRYVPALKSSARRVTEALSLQAAPSKAA